MPRRVTVTRSRSYKTLFGTRVTRRVTYTEPTHPSYNYRTKAPVQVHIHVTGSGDPQEPQQPQYIDRFGIATQINAESQAAHDAVMHNLSRPAQLLHTKPYAWGALALYTLCFIVTFATSGGAPLIIVPWVALAVMDWHNFSTLHGRIPWRRWWTLNKTWVIVGFFFLYWFAFISPFIYLAQCLSLEGTVCEIERQKLDASIAALEAQLMPTPPAPASAAPEPLAPFGTNTPAVPTDTPLLVSQAPEPLLQPIETAPLQPVLGTAEQERQRWLSYMESPIALAALAPSQFEEFIGDLLRADGYHDVIRVGQAGDLSADLMCHTPNGELVVVQCKRYAPGSQVGSPEIQQFIGMITVHHRAQHGIYVTTSSFSKPAADLAAQHGVKAIDGVALSDWVRRIRLRGTGGTEIV